MREPTEAVRINYCALQGNLEQGVMVWTFSGRGRPHAIN